MAANVNKPTDIKKKDADVNRKLQVYGIFEAFKAGKVPSNDQIDVALNSFLESKALSKPSDKLSDEGKELVGDTREVVELAKKLLLSKNEGNLLQDFIWQTTQFDPKSIEGPAKPTDKDSAKRDGDDALQGLRTLGTLLITNGQFRKLLKDASILLRDMAGDAAGNAASRVRPSEEQLGQIDNAADDNTWHEAPKFDKEGLKKSAQGLYKGDAKQDAKNIAKEGADAAAPKGSETTAKDADGQAGKSAVKDGLKKKIDQNVDQETQDNLKARNEEYRRRAREYLNKKMPEERKDQIIWRLKKMVIECQQHPDYSQAIQTILRLAETYGKHGQALGKDSNSTVKQTRTGLAAAEQDLRTLIERFANGTSTSNLWESIGQIYKDAEKDDELKGWFKNMDRYIRRCLLEQGYVLEDASNEEWNRLYEQGRHLLREKYKGHTDRVIDEVKFVGDQFDQDPLNKKFGLAVQRLFQHLGNDSNGKPQFKKHLVKDLFEVIIPGILENTAYIPIPRIEFSDPKVDVAIENLVLESDNFMPNVVDIHSEHAFRWGRKKIANKNANTMDVKVSGVQMDLRDVSFHIKKKGGFPSVTDTGVADILLPGDGLSFRMKVSTAGKTDRQNYFKVDKVDVDFKSLNVKLKKSSYKGIFGLLKPLILRAMRPALQKAVEKAIKDKCNELDGVISQLKRDADAAGEANKSNPDGPQPNFYKRFYDAAQKRALKNKEKAKEEAKNKADDKKVNVAMTKEDSIFPKLDLPGGVSTKATEYKELARKGDKWESPVFSIGNAKKSTDLPSAPEIQRKSRSDATTNGAHTNGNSVGVTNGKAPALATNGATNGTTRV